MTSCLSGTNAHEVSDGIYHINLPVIMKGAGGLSFNQLLITDDELLNSEMAIPKDVSAPV